MLNVLMAHEMAKRTLREISEDAFERLIAQKKFDRARRKSQMRSLMGRSHRLRKLATQHQKAGEGHYLGVRTISLDLIQGSENRAADFDSEFLPLRDYMEERWINVAVAVQRGVKMPPVELIKAGNTYFVRDGHHRISVARAFGQVSIEAEITVWDE